MSKRRKLPAPPLVLSPYLIRLHEVSPRVGLLLRLARFLQEKNLLTDGGIRNLEDGLVGRNERRSLSTQDVRGWAHGLVLELWECADGRDWNILHDDYFRRYDRGKPRRPNHLQRLCLEWSSNTHWTGLLTTAFRHSHLWQEVEVAVSRLDLEHPERRVLEVALRARSEPSAWCEAWDGKTVDRAGLLRLWRVLSTPPPAQKLEVIGLRLEAIEQSEKLALLGLEAMLLSSIQARQVEVSEQLSHQLEQFALNTISRLDDFVTPAALAALRGFVRDPKTPESLNALVRAEDPIRRVTFGPRPGQNWLSTFLDELRGLIELRSSSFSR